MVYSNPVYVSTPQLQLTAKFLKSMIWIMQDGIIHSLSRMENCMQSEGELRFCILLYKTFVNLDFKMLRKKVIVTMG